MRFSEIGKAILSDTSMLPRSRDEAGSRVEALWELAESLAALPETAGDVAPPTVSHIIVKLEEGKDKLPISAEVLEDGISALRNVVARRPSHVPGKQPVAA